MISDLRMESNKSSQELLRDLITDLIINLQGRINVTCGYCNKIVTIDLDNEFVSAHECTVDINLTYEGFMASMRMTRAKEVLESD